MMICRACGADIAPGAPVCGICQVPVLDPQRPPSEFDTQEPGDDDIASAFAEAMTEAAADPPEPAAALDALLASAPPETPVPPPLPAVPEPLAPPAMQEPAVPPVTSVASESAARPVPEPAASPPPPVASEFAAASAAPPAPEPTEVTAEPPVAAPPATEGGMTKEHHCLVCGAELEPDARKCDSCGTPVPDYAKPMMETVTMEGHTGTSRLALWSAALVGLGFCIPLAPFAGIPVGVFAMRQIEDSEDRLGGRGIAMFGMFGGGLFGALQLFLILAILAPAMFGGVSLLAGLAGSGEDVGMQAIKRLYEAEAIARFSVAVDADEDGLGEFCSMARLGEGTMPYLRKDFADGSIGGYWLQVVLPQGTDARELDWWGIAQPQSARRGWRTIVVDSRGVIRVKNTEGAPPNLADLGSWDAVDMVMSRYDVDAQAAQAEIARMQYHQLHGQQNP